MSAAVSGVAHLLAEAGVGAYSETEALPEDQTPITVATMPAAPDLALSLTTYPGGPEPDSRNGWEYPRLQVRVRGAQPLAALDLDRAAFVVLQGAQGRLAGGWWLQDCHAIQSEAQPMGADSSGRHEFARNYQLTVHPNP